MKKNYLLAAMASGVMLFSACSNDEAIMNGSDNNAEQTLVLQVASTGDNLTTRAGRPLLSSEAKQAIDNVKVIICQGTGNGNVKYVKTLDKWSDTSDASSKPYGGDTGGHGREAIIKLADGDKLATGDYTVYAFGYSNNSDYTDLATKITDIAKNGDFSENVTLTLNQTGGNKIGEEIFAGSCALKVEDGKGFYTPVVLNRQVAGTMAYLTDIPCVAGGTKLQLVASDRNTNLVLGHFANHDLDGNGTAADADVNYVVNGTATAADKVIYEIVLGDWFSNPALDADKNGLIDAETNWKGDAAKYANGSVFAGNFVIPFAKTTESTFTLQLVDNSNNALKSWKVKLPASDKQLSSHTSYIWNSNNTSFTESTTAQDAADIFNVVRNHLYSIGTRTLDEPTQPGTDPDDKPESLVNKQELVLKVNDNWEVIHNMELE
jgi:hypothetical protein